MNQNDGCAVLWFSAANGLFGASVVLSVKRWWAIYLRENHQRDYKKIQRIEQVIVQIVVAGPGQISGMIDEIFVSHVLFE